MAFAKNPVGDIAGEGQAGDQNHDKPKLLQIEGIVGPEGLRREKGQNRQRNQRKADHRIDIGRPQLSQHAVQF